MKVFFNEEHDMLRENLRKFVQNEVEPHAEEWDEREGFPRQLFKKLGDLGYLGLSYPEEYGGGGGDYFTVVILAEELGRCSTQGIAAAMLMQVGCATPPVLAFGTEEQKQKYLVPAIKGEKIACLGITEPNAGSDVANVSTYAEKVPGGWKVNGNKIFITNGVEADFMTLLARTDKTGGPKGISLFLVDTDSPGFSVSRKLHKAGLRSSDTAEIFFEDMFVPDENLLGEEGKGFRNIMWELQGERLVAAASYVAQSEYVLETAINYAKERVQFGKPIIQNQAITHRVADLAARIESVKCLVYCTAWKFDQKQYPVKEISMAKLLAAQLAFDVTDEAIQIMGGHGYMMEYPMQRAFRDARLSRIVGGTDEIQREVIITTLGLRA